MKTLATFPNNDQLQKPKKIVCPNQYFKNAIAHQLSLPLGKVTFQKVYPHKFQIFTSRNDCDGISMIQWESELLMAEVVDPVKDLNITVRANHLIRCLGLTIFQMNTGQNAMLEELTGKHRPHSEWNEDLLKK